MNEKDPMKNPKHMNIVQEIFMILLDETHFNVLESGLSMREKYLIKNIRSAHSFKKMTVDKTLEGKSVLIWDSAIGNTIACPVTSLGFYFSQTETYKTSFRSLRGKIQDRFPGDKEKLETVKLEIETIKAMFMDYSKDIEKYLR